MELHEWEGAHMASGSRHDAKRRTVVENCGKTETPLTLTSASTSTLLIQSLVPH